MRSFRSYLVNALLRLLAKRRFDPSRDLIAYREHLQRVDSRLYRLPRGLHRERIVADAIDCEWIGESGIETQRVLLYLHGGGFFLRTPQVHGRLAGRIAATLGCRALIPDYRLAPEYPFPSAPEDCLRVYRWLLEQGTEPAEIVIAGDSAGGNLALATLLMARDAGLPLPACGVCLSPGIDLTLGGFTLVSNERRDPMFRLQTLLIMKHAYLAGADPGDPLASPVNASFRDFPPLLFQVGDTELLLDHATRAYARARAAGLPTQLSVWRGMPHVFQAFASLPEAAQAVAEIAAFVERVAGWSLPVLSRRQR